MSTEPKQDKKRGRPPRPFPVIEATPEEVAKALINLPPNHKWQYEEHDKA